ncbi:ATP-binding cassette domain-containing protein [bacterium]|nr:ATP-binding cassette domain-containing protein [bacterium]
MGEVVLTVDDLAVAIAGTRLLEGISFSLHAGECVACVGPSGCGKSTFLRTVSGLIDADDGNVHLNGKQPSDHCWPVFRRQVVYVTQRPTLLDESVLGNLKRPFDYAIANSGFPEHRAKDLVAELRLENGVMEKNARELSVGQQQRVCLVRSLLVEPKVLLLDEPTSALDEEAVAIVEELLDAESKRTGLALLVVTHNRAQADRWSDRIVNLGDHVVPREGADE